LKKIISSKIDLRDVVMALDNTSIVAITDGNGTITYVNDKFCQVSKYSREELIGQNHRILKSGFHSTEFFQNLWMNISSGNVWGGDIKNKAKDGSYYWVRTIITPFFRNGKKPEKYIAIRTIVSEEKLAEEKAKMKAQDIYEQKVIADKKIEQLKEIEKMKDEFIAMISHDLKNPLIPIKGNCELFNDPKIGGKLNPFQKELIKEIEESSDMLENMFEDLLDVQKINLKKMNFKLQVIEARKIVSSIIQNLSPIFREKQITLENSCDESIQVYADKKGMIRVFDNLIKNAVDFVPTKDGRIEIGCTKENSKHIFFVKDNGSGIAKEKQKLLFKKFHTLNSTHNRRYGGSGLGLIIVKGIVEGLGGRIWLESELDKGTTFYFSIPVRKI